MSSILTKLAAAVRDTNGCYLDFLNSPFFQGTTNRWGQNFAAKLKNWRYRLTASVIGLTGTVKLSVNS